MTIRWGIVGCGDVTEVKSGPAFQKASHSSLVAVMRRTPGLAQGFAQRHGVPRWYDTVEGLIGDSEVDAVYVATPVGTHCDVALRVCAAGKPVLVEKPMARSHEECVRMIDAFAAAGQRLFVAYYRRALPRFLEVKNLIDSGRLGTVSGIRYAYASPRHRNTDARNPGWRFDAERSGGGLLLDLGSHALDIIDFLVGPLSEFKGIATHVGSPYEVEDTVVMHFRCERALGVASFYFASDTREDRLEVVGADGAVSLSVFGDSPVKLATKGEAQTFSFRNPSSIEQPLIQTVVDELRGESVCPSTGQSAARTSYVMDEVLRAYYGTRRGAFWRTPASWPGRAGR